VVFSSLFWEGFDILVYSSHGFCGCMQGLDVNRLARQLEKAAPLSEMLGQHMRCMQCFANRHFVDSYVSLEKSAKYVCKMIV
jgi:hypothetical protein